MPRETSWLSERTLSRTPVTIVSGLVFVLTRSALPRIRFCILFKYKVQRVSLPRPRSRESAAIPTIVNQRPSGCKFTSWICCPIGSASAK